MNPGPGMVGQATSLGSWHRNSVIIASPTGALPSSSSAFHDSYSVHSGKFHTAFITASPVLEVMSWQYCVAEVGRSRSGAASSAVEMGNSHVRHHSIRTEWEKGPSLLAAALGDAVLKCWGKSGRLFPPVLGGCDCRCLPWFRSVQLFVVKSHREDGEMGLISCELQGRVFLKISHVNLLK